MRNELYTTNTEKQAAQLNWHWRGKNSSSSSSKVTNVFPNGMSDALVCAVVQGTHIPGGEAMPL